MRIASRRPHVSAVLSPSTLALIIALSCIAVDNSAAGVEHLLKSGVDRTRHRVDTESAMWHSGLLHDKIRDRLGVIGNGVAILVEHVACTELEVIVDFINVLRPSAYEVKVSY